MGVFGHPTGLNLELLGMPGIVGVQKCDMIPRSQIPAGVAGRSRSSIGGQPHNLDPHGPAAISKCLRARRRRVLAAIIHDDNLARKRRLGENGRDRPMERILSVVGWDDDGDTHTSPCGNALGVIWITRAKRPRDATGGCAAWSGSTASGATQGRHRSCLTLRTSLVQKNRGNRSIPLRWNAWMIPRTLLASREPPVADPHRPSPAARRTVPPADAPTPAISTCPPARGESRTHWRSR